MQRNAICYPVILVVTIIMLIPSCSGSSDTVRLKKFFGQLIKNVEKNDPDSFLLSISPDYLDAEERTYEDISRLVHSYMGRYKGIVINLLDLEVISIGQSEANITAEVSFSHGAAQALRKMLQMSIRFFSFEIQLTTEADSWKISSAIWNQKESEELSPEALESLRDLFPNVF